MAELQINLPDSISEFADAQVASGRFPVLIVVPKPADLRALAPSRESFQPPIIE
jgi:hypothetical protein